MNFKTFVDSFSKMPGRGFTIDKNQRETISYSNGPLWVVAGPGSGKTDSLVLRCLKLMVVDEITPGSIIVTTFTDKAANNLQDRVSQYMEYLASVDPAVRAIDQTRIRIGTLHSLCDDVMQEFRYSGYQNFRLLDDLEQKLFIMEHCSPVSIDKRIVARFEEVWKTIPYVFEGFDAVTNARWTATSTYPPNRYIRARGFQNLFNRIVEELVDIRKMKSTNGYRALAEAYEEYRDKLFERYRCDFAHVQSKFLEFLNSSQAELFLKGNGTDQYPGVNHVLVDEYQDTNSIQEAIYLKLADQSHNLCVVGDDDQALYRFRGGTVECMVNFENASLIKWPGVGVVKKFLSTNYRSHSKIVDFCDGYIHSFPEMLKKGVRVDGKPRLEHGSEIVGDYPAVAIHQEKSMDDLAEYFATLVEGLLANNVISDYSQCVLLLHSVRDSSNNAGPFMQALRGHGIPFYNPRSRSLLDEPVIKTVLGALLSILDPDREAQSALVLQTIRDRVDDWRMEFANMAKSNRGISKYIEEYAEKIKIKGPRVPVGFNLLEIFYHILNYPPLNRWIDDPDMSVKLGVLSSVLDAFSNVPTAENPDNMLGFLYTSSNANKGVSFGWRKKFYYSLIGLLAAEGLNEAEDPIESFPLGYLPIMTVHQAKGLQFPFVFVSGLSKDKNDLSSALLETEFSKFRNAERRIISKASPSEKAKQDAIRFFYVAYSRARYALVLLATKKEYRRPGNGFGGSSKWSVFSNATEI